jgi:hypothetical protein
MTNLTHSLCDAQATPGADLSHPDFLRLEGEAGMPAHLGVRLMRLAEVGHRRRRRRRRRRMMMMMMMSFSCL